MSDPMLRLYAVRNRDGCYFRSKGRGGHGETWVDCLEKARIYPRPGPARAQVTFFANKWVDFGIPELVELRVTEAVAVDETERVKKSQKRKAKEVAEFKYRQHLWEKEQAEKKLIEAQETLARLRKGDKP